jgi:hypothetical protein
MLLWPSQRRFLVNAVFTSAALPASALRWLTSPPADAPATSGIRKVGRADIDAIRELTHSYREMDNRLGGGKLRSTIVSYLDDHVSRLLTTGNYREETGRQLAAACGELSQLAGLPTTATSTAWPSGTSPRRWPMRGTPVTRLLRRRSSLPRRTRRSTWPGQMRRSTSPEPPRLRPSATGRPPCSLNAWSWKLTGTPPATTRTPAVPRSLGQSGHLTAQPAKMTRCGSPGREMTVDPGGGHDVWLPLGERQRPGGAAGPNRSSRTIPPPGYRPPRMPSSDWKWQA